MYSEIKNRFATTDIEQKRDNLAKVVVDRHRLFDLITMLNREYDYITLTAITCADWIEDEHFALSYILTRADRKHAIMVQSMIGRDEPHIESIVGSFKQAQIMERDLHEMYGIDFIGNDNLVELSLENWIHTPPLRREFDTLEFVNNNLTFRDGRDDNMDVKKEMKRLRALKKAQKEAAKKEKELKSDNSKESPDAKQ
ncbi:NADH-ubiquinone oxidoreductase chain C [hydrothermal vent metagenome]|uniref:NADH-ubiquinone oxidoreductase chain C n=1 Tax=hydrothermal vent metagenome TaxID=652676 RepID=A0A1W1CAI9_9ZZZZ